MDFFCGLFGKRNKKKKQNGETETISEPDSIRNSGDKSLDEMDTGRRPSSRIFLKGKGVYASIRYMAAERRPLFLSDVQRFLLLAITDPFKFDYFSCHWAHIINRTMLVNVCVLVVDGISLYDYINYQGKLDTFNNYFAESGVEMLTTNITLKAIIESLTVLLLFYEKQEEMIRKFGSLDIYVNQLNDPNIDLSSVFPVDTSSLRTKVSHDFNRLTLLLPASQMLAEKYPVPIAGKKEDYKDYLHTKNKYWPVHMDSPMYSLDCERCNTEGGSEVFRISIVGERDNIIYNTYVHPEYNILGRRNVFSEISKYELLQVKTRLADVQQHLREVLPRDAILVGQSLNYDLHALKLLHPYVINTSCIFNMSGSRKFKSKLKHLTLHHLDREIQNRSKGHCSVEDAEATIDLVKLKLRNSPEYGDVILEEHKNNHINNRVDNKSQRGPYVVIANEEVRKNYVAAAYRVHSENSDFLKSVFKIVPSNTIAEMEKLSSKILRAHKLIVMHLECKTEAKASLLALDKLIAKIWNTATSTTLLTILMTGNNQYNGALFYNINNV